MSIFSRLLKKGFTQTAKEYNKVIFNWLGSNSVYYNPDNDDAYIKDGYQSNATVYSIINMIVNNAAAVPFQIFEVKNKGKAAQYKSLTSEGINSDNYIRSRVLKERAFEVLEDTELHELLYQPNPSEGYSEWLNNLIAFGKLTGNRYIYGISPKTGMNAGKVSEMYILPSQHMEIVSGGFMKPIKEYRLNYNTTQTIPVEDICHIKDFNPQFDVSGTQLYGQSPLMAAYRNLAINNEAIDTSKKMLDNQAARGVLVAKEQGAIDQLQAKQLDETLKKKMYDNRGGIAITGQPMDWINFGLSPTDMQILEQIDLTSQQLCQVYGVPPGLLGLDKDSTYENQKEWKKALFQNAVIPELNHIKHELNRWLVPQYGENLYLDFDYSAIPALQEDSEKVTQQLKDADWLTLNEKRSVQDYEPNQEDLADELLVNQGLVPLRDLSFGDLDIE